MKQLTHSQFARLIAARTGAEIMVILATTAPRCYGGKAAPHVEKSVARRVMIGVDYGASVTRESGEKFSAQPRKWGEYVIRDKVVTHKGGLYLCTRSTPRNRGVYHAIWRLGGVVCQPDEAIRYVIPPTPSARQERVGLSAPAQIHCRDYSFASIRRVHFRKQKFELVPD